MEKMNGNLQTLLEKLDRMPGRGTTPSQSRVSFAPSASQIPARSAKAESQVKKFPGLDAAVVSAALARWCARGEPHGDATPDWLRRQSDPAFARASPQEPCEKEAMQYAEALDESEEEPEPGFSGGEPGLAEVGEPATVEGTLSKLTELVALLSADKLKRAKASKMDLALDGVHASGSTGDSSSGSAGKRAAAARRALRVGLQRRRRKSAMWWRS